MKKNNVTLKWLQDNNACEPAVKKFIEIFGKSADLKRIIKYTIDENNDTYLQYANWLIVRKMNHAQQIRYAIFAAEQVLNIYETKYPDDDRPRKSIEAAKKYLKAKNKEAARAAEAAAGAAEAAAGAAARAAAWAAWAAGAAGAARAA